MTEHPLCKGCGGRMTVEDPDTHTHPNVDCYKEYIKRLKYKVENLRKELKRERE